MIDSHQHFWNFDPVRDSWINDDMQVIRRDFMPADLEPMLKQTGFEGTVAVQVDQSEADTIFLLRLADEHDFIKGVVGWVDLQAEDIDSTLQYYTSFKKLKGFRHILQGEKNRALMLEPQFKRGIEALAEFDFTYDILVYADQLKYVKQFVAGFPSQKFVIDHLAKPYIKKAEIDQWKIEMEAIASHENVWCKVSGMVTEADWKNWKQTDFHPYLDVVTAAFGVKRLMYGSDWPVCLVAASYQQALDIVKKYYAGFSPEEQQLIFGGNAKEFYQLQ